MFERNDKEWIENPLRELFCELIEEISKSKKITIFVNALDEAGETVAKRLAEDLTSLYKQVQRRGATFKILLLESPLSNTAFEGD